jgi:hypothetical protein
VTRGILLLLLLRHPHDVTAFTRSIEYRRFASAAPLVSLPTSMTSSTRYSATLRFATTYLPDGWVDDDDDDSSAARFGSHSNGRIPPILQTPEWVAPLARLAVGHNPHGGLHLQQIEQVSVRNVAPSHVDIEAVVCEQDGCVSLLVPVPFTQPCAPSAFEDCVVRQIQELDSVQLQKATFPLETTAPIEYPSWWIYPTATATLEFAQECTALLGILQEPTFRDDVRTVVTKELRRMLSLEAADVVQVQQAHAVAVGPCGLIFRVSALYYGQPEVVDVPVPFAAGGLVSVSDQDPRALREAVLECIENAAP